MLYLCIAGIMVAIIGIIVFYKIKRGGSKNIIETISDVANSEWNDV